MSKKYIFISFLTTALLMAFYFLGFPTFGQTSDGICTDPDGTSKDSDGGYNVIKKGTAFGYSQFGEGPRTFTDYCISDTTLVEYACGCSNNKVVCVAYEGASCASDVSGLVCRNGACVRPGTGTSSSPTPTPSSRAQTPTPTPSSSIPSSFPSITVLSPNGGEVWKEGETHDITWSAAGANGLSVQIWIYQGDCALMKTEGIAIGGRSAYPINDEGILASAGKYSWKIPAGLTKMGEFVKAYGWGLDGGDNLCIGVIGLTEMDGTTYSWGGLSDSFRITSSAQAPVFPTIKVLSPNGREKWELGKIHEIKWQVQGDVSKVGIFLYRGEKGEIPVGWIGKDIPADNGSFRWAISTIEEGNNYKIGVFQYPFEKRRTGDIIHYGPVDFSDGFFSIVGP